jgi:hypothetical protein
MPPAVAEELAFEEEEEEEALYEEEADADQAGEEGWEDSAVLTAFEDAVERYQVEHGLRTASSGACLASERRERRALTVFSRRRGDSTNPEEQACCSCRHHLSSCVARLEGAAERRGSAGGR